jgi:hypothetical protein
LILGAAPYMSPEQAQGSLADALSEIRGEASQDVAIAVDGERKV